jgi:copper chaperone
MVTFQVEKMSCGGCAARITRAIQVLDPRAKVDVSLHERLVRVDSDKSPQVIAEAMTSSGFSIRQVAQA